MLKLLDNQNDVLNFKNCDSKRILLGDFIARTGVSEDFVELGNEHNAISCKSNQDKITNTKGPDNGNEYWYWKDWNR